MPFSLPVWRTNKTRPLKKLGLIEDTSAMAADRSAILIGKHPFAACKKPFHRIRTPQPLAGLTVAIGMVRGRNSIRARRWGCDFRKRKTMHFCSVVFGPEQS